MQILHDQAEIEIDIVKVQFTGLDFGKINDALGFFICVIRKKDTGRLELFCDVVTRFFMKNRNGVTDKYYCLWQDKSKVAPKHFDHSAVLQRITKTRGEIASR